MHLMAMLEILHQLVQCGSRITLYKFMEYFPMHFSSFLLSAKQEKQTAKLFMRTSNVNQRTRNELARLGQTRKHAKYPHDE